MLKVWMVTKWNIKSFIWSPFKPTCFVRTKMKAILMHERIDGSSVTVEYHTLPLKKIAFTLFFSLFTKTHNGISLSHLSFSLVFRSNNDELSVSSSRGSSGSSMSNTARRPQVQVPHFPKVSLPTMAFLLGTILFVSPYNQVYTLHTM